jgi:hypothetical protein
MAGYSGTPLDQKLGIKPGQRVLVEGAPDGFVGGALRFPEDVTVVGAPKSPIDVAIVFVTSRAQLEARWQPVTTSLRADSAFWVAWPKKKPTDGSAPVPTDMTENVVRDVGLPGGLVDNKVCAIDDVWSGLRLVIRKENRASWPWGR